MSVQIASSDIQQNAFRQADHYLTKLFRPQRVYVVSITEFQEIYTNIENEFKPVFIKQQKKN